MKIAYLIPKPANTGPILVVLELVKAMSKHGHDCTVFYFDEGDEVLFPCKTQRISFFQKINFREFDIVHSHGLRPDCYLFLHKPLRCKALCLTTLHNYIIPDFSYQYNKFIAYTVGNLWMLALRRHDTIVTLSKDALQYYRRRLPARKLTYAYNTRQVALDAPLDVQTRQQILQFKQGAVTLGVNAALTDRKGIDQVIRALKNCRDTNLSSPETEKARLPWKNCPSTSKWQTGYCFWATGKTLTAFCLITTCSCCRAGAKDLGLP